MLVTVRGRRTSFALLALLSGCLGPSPSPDVQIVLDSPDGVVASELSFELVAAIAPDESVATCEAFLVDPAALHVASGTAFVRFQPGTDGTGPALTDLSFGPVRFFVRARDASCRLILAGCTDADVGTSGPGAVTIALTMLDGSSACGATDRCVGYTCTSEACVGAEMPRDEDGDGAFVCTPSPVDAEDCDDRDPARSPLLPEICNGSDEDCDGLVDEGVATRTFYADGDGDGWGDGTNSRDGCAPPEGFVTRDGDCDDADADVFPDAPLRCSGADDDCDGTVDPSPAIAAFPDGDEDGHGAEGSEATIVCGALPMGTARTADDCNDESYDRHPGATEACNGADDDCDGSVDESVAERDYYLDGDGDGYGAGTAMRDCARPGAEWVTRRGDCNDANAAFHPGARDRCCTLPDEGCGPTATAVGGGVSCSNGVYPHYRWFEEAVIGRGRFNPTANVTDTVFQGWVRSLSGRSSTWSCFTTLYGDVTRGRALFCVRKGRTGSAPTTPYPCTSSCNDFPTTGAESLTAVKAAVCWAATAGSGAYGRRIITSGACDPSTPRACCAGRLLRQSDAAIILFNAFGPEQTVCAP